MIRVKRRTFAGVVCEQEVYYTTLSRNYKNSNPRPRFENEEERLQHRTEISRRRFVGLVNENFSSTSLYTTLTFDTEHEIHCPSRKMKDKDPRYEEALAAAYKELKKIRDRYIKNLKRKYPDAVITVVMGRGASTDRMHLHMISEGIPEEDIIGKWKYGCICRIENLRDHNIYDGIDHGQDFTKLANYLFNHWEPEQGCHRYKITRNARKPEREDAQICKRVYTEEKAPQAPKGYILVETKSNKYGYCYFKYILDPDIQDQNIIYRRKRKKA